MAIMSINYNSETLGKHQRFMAILPENNSQFDVTIQAKPMKSLLLLHGLSSDETMFTRYTNIERIADEKQIAVIMPSGDHSGYANMTYGHSYYDYVLEVYQYAQQILPLSHKREDHFIAGNSMGGYGTIKYALTQPEMFSKACMLSAVFNADFLLNNNFPDFSSKAIFGNVNTVENTEFDTYYLLEQALKQEKQLPELYVLCGTEDELYQNNIDFTRHLSDKHIPYKSDFSPGEHNWKYWNEAIEKALEWFDS